MKRSQMGRSSRSSPWHTTPVGDFWPQVTASRQSPSGRQASGESDRCKRSSAHDFSETTVAFSSDGRAYRFPRASMGSRRSGTSIAGGSFPHSMASPWADFGARPSIPTAAGSPWPGSRRSSECGNRRAASYGSLAATRIESPAWPSTPMAGSWPRPVTTRPCGSGTQRQGDCYAHTATRACFLTCVSRSPRMAARWPRAITAAR